MKLKLDENLGDRGRALLVAAGHDVATVPQQQMGAASDAALIAACRSEGRALVTLDLDFANPLDYRPSEYPGIAVLRLPKDTSPSDLLQTMQTLAGGLETNAITGQLWIVEKGRIRIYQPED